MFSFTLSSSSSNSSLLSNSSASHKIGGLLSLSSTSGRNLSSSAFSNDPHKATNQIFAARMAAQESLAQNPIAMGEAADADCHQQGHDDALFAHGCPVSRQPNVAAVLSDAQELLRAANQMIRTSCGEAWLLQPYIEDMPQSEYR